MRKYILSLLVSVSVFAEVRLGDVALRRIVVPKDAADTVVLAGRELQSFLEKVAGNRL